MIRIFNALLRLAEIDAGLRRANFVQSDVTDLLARAVEFYLPAAELKGLSLSLRDSAPAWARCDPVLLAQAINNLIDNSLKFIPSGSHIEIGAVAASAEMIAVVVADDGPGIPDADRPRATQRFFRGDASRATPGVGLGLSLVEAIARLHGGSLELTDNHPGLRAQMLIERGAAAAPASPGHQRLDLGGPQRDVEITA